MNGNFSTHLTGRSQFSRVAKDMVIEMTLNEDMETPGGWAGFSRNANAVKR